MRTLLVATVVVSLAGLTACKSAPKKPPAPDPNIALLAEADTKFLEGCYDCLLEARIAYERVAAGPARPTVINRLFETNLLIALREKEFALDSSDALSRARQIATELAPDVAADRVLAIVDAVPEDDQGATHKEALAFSRAHAAFLPKVDAEVEWLKTGGSLLPVVREYLALSLDCGYASRRRGSQADRPAPPADAAPLIKYRTAICWPLVQPVLYRLHADYPRFVESAQFLARFDIAVAQQNGPGHARELLAEVYGRFPKSPAVTFASGRLYQLIGDCGTALRYYNETIAIRPEHEGGMLGRTMCLTYLKRNTEAIDTATRMIDLRTDNVRDAYYWRAYNHHVLQELPAARADIEAAKRMGANPQTETLAGIIEHDQDDLTIAQRDLEGALAMSEGNTNCTAMWYLGLVHMKRQEWIDSAKQFEVAMDCYQAHVLGDTASLAAMEGRTELDPEFRARQIEGFKAAIKEDTAQYHASAFNAANYYATGGNIPLAKKYVEIAARDESLAEKVNKLKDWLKDK